MSAASVELFVPGNPPHLYRAISPFAVTTLDLSQGEKGALLALDAPGQHYGRVEAECAERTLLVFTCGIEICTEDVASASSAFLKQFRTGVI